MKLYLILLQIKNKIIYAWNNFIFWLDFKLRSIGKISPNRVVENIINYQLKPYKVDFDYIMKNQHINGIPWYQYYKFTSEKQVRKYEKYAKKQIRKAYPYMTEKYINREYAMFDLMYGLMRDYPEYNNLMNRK